MPTRRCSRLIVGLGRADRGATSCAHARPARPRRHPRQRLHDQADERRRQRSTAIARTRHRRDDGPERGVRHAASSRPTRSSRSFQGTVNRLAITIGNALLPPLTLAAEHLGNLVNIAQRCRDGVAPGHGRRRAAGHSADRADGPALRRRFLGLERVTPRHRQGRSRGRQARHAAGRQVAPIRHRHVMAVVALILDRGLNQWARWHDPRRPSKAELQARTAAAIIGEPADRGAERPRRPACPPSRPGPVRGHARAGHRRAVETLGKRAPKTSSRLSAADEAAEAMRTPPRGASRSGARTWRCTGAAVLEERLRARGGDRTTRRRLTQLEPRQLSWPIERGPRSA